MLNQHKSQTGLKKNPHLDVSWSKWQNTKDQKNLKRQQA